MLRDEVVTVALLLVFATFATIHAVLVAGLAARPRRWRAAIALLAVPLAPYWGFKEGMRRLATAWIASGVAYGLCLWLAR
jgi:hypothetical protein